MSDPVTPRVPFGRLRLALKLLLLSPAFLVGLPLQWLALRIGFRAAYRWMPVWFHRYVLAVLGVRVERHGRPDPQRPMLIVSNHLSWLDILVISALMPVSFIAKSEVAGWPVFGTLARLQRSIFVERARRGKTAEVNAAIAARLADGDAMLLFAEGTTSDGMRVLPFRSALIGAAQAATSGESAPTAIQTLDIAYPRIAGLPSGRADLPAIAWYGDMDLLPHLADLLALPGITAQVTFGSVWQVAPGADRKLLAREMESEVRRFHAHAMTGRARDPA